MLHVLCCDVNVVRPPAPAHHNTTRMACTRELCDNNSWSAYVPCSSAQNGIVMVEQRPVWLPLPEPIFQSFMFFAYLPKHIKLLIPQHPSCCMRACVPNLHLRHERNSTVPPCCPPPSSARWAEMCGICPWGISARLHRYTLLFLVGR